MNKVFSQSVENYRQDKRMRKRERFVRLRFNLLILLLFA